MYKDPYKSPRNRVKHALRWEFLQALEVLFRNDINEEVENFMIINAGRYVTFLLYTYLYLKSAAFGIQCEGPCPVGQLHDEYFAGFGEEDGSFGGNHLN